jgi:lysophospholipase L1-like esterase
MKKARWMNAAVGLGLIGYAVSDHSFYGGTPGFGSVQAIIAGVGVALVVVAALLGHERNQNILLLTVMSLVMVGVTEVVTERVLGSFLRPPYDYDDVLLFKLRPGVESVRAVHPDNGGGTVAHAINSDGFRGPELDKARSKPRVMVYGDSFIHATYATEEQTFVRLVGAQLAAAGKPVEMVNAGVSSYGPDQTLLRLKPDLQRYKPALVIFSVFGGNDYGDLMRNKIFRVGPDGALVPNQHKVDPQVAAVFALNRDSSVMLRGIKALRELTRPEVLEGPGTTDADKARLFEQWMTLAAGEYREHVVEKDPIVRNTHIDHYSADVSAEPNGEAARYKIALMRLVLARLIEVTRAANIPLAFVFIPHPMDVGADFPYAAIDPVKYPDYRPRNLIDPLVEVTRTSSVPYLDVFDLYRAQPDISAMYLKSGDDHWSPRGQVVAAEAMTKLILDAGLLDAPAAPAP